MNTIFYSDGKDMGDAGIHYLCESDTCKAEELNICKYSIV